ncbi:hypothetical protein M422DRAFT_243548 [Sphaerobolus stellatus SS14]|nr:hypothetical protein M422DRAFT_243548 [Sphaerobolus stellatus SS14]
MAPREHCIVYPQLDRAKLSKYVALGFQCRATTSCIHNGLVGLQVDEKDSEIIPASLPHHAAHIFHSIHSSSIYRIISMTESNDVQPQDIEGPQQSQSTLDASQATGPANNTTAKLVQRCLAIVEQQRRGEIRTSEATWCFLGELPASEEGESALEQYVEMCVEMD